MNRENQGILPLSRIFELAAINQNRHSRSLLYTYLAIVELTMTAGILLFLFGGIYYGRTAREIVHYKNSSCEVDSSRFHTSVCKRIYGSFLCYTAVWYVRYGTEYSISSEIQHSGFRRLSQSVKILETYQVSVWFRNDQLIEIRKTCLISVESIALSFSFQSRSVYPCWYDDRNVSSVRWMKPNYTAGIILYLLATILVLCATFLSIVLCKSWRRQIWRESNLSGDNLLDVNDQNDR